MSWLNLNESLNSLKGQITNFASEVLAEGSSTAEGDDESYTELEAANIKVDELNEKCRFQSDEINALRKLNDDLQATLQAERLFRKNGIASREEESSWFWDPPTQGPPQQPTQPEVPSTDEDSLQLQALQQQISTLKVQLNDKTRIENEGNVELIRLREENEKLSTNLEDLDNQHQMAMERLLALKKELQKNFEILKHDHEVLKSANYQYSKEVEELKTKLVEKDNVISHGPGAAKSDYETLHHKYMNLERIHSVLQESTEKFQEENQELHEEIFKLQEELTKHENDEEVLKHPKATDMIPREKYEELLKELLQLQENRRSTGLLHLDDTNIDDNAKSVIENLKRDISDLRHELAQKGESDAGASSSVQVIGTDKLIQTYNKYVNFDLPVDYVGEIPTTGESQVIFKIEGAFKALNSFKKEIDVLEHKLSEKTLNETHFQRQIDDLTSDNDFLTADLGQCERDISEMKKNNDYLLSEITALKNASKLEPIIESHEDNIVKLESELADCNKMNKNFENEIKTIEKELSEVNNEKTLLHTDLNDLREKYNHMLLELDNCKSHYVSVQQLEIDTQMDRNEKLRRAAEEIDELKRKLTATASKNEQLNIDFSIVENEKVLLTRQLDDLKHTLEERNNNCEEIAAARMILEHNVSKLEERVAELIKLKGEAEINLKTLLKKLEILVTQTENPEQILEYLNSLQSVEQQADKHISEVLLRLLQFITTESTLTSELQELKKSDNSKVNDKVIELSKEKSALLDNIQLQNNDIEIYKKREEDLTLELARLNDNLSSESANMSHFKDEISGLKSKLEDHEMCEKEIEGLRQDKHHLLEIKTLFENDLALAEQRISFVNDKVEKLVEDVKAKDEEIASLTSTVQASYANATSLNETVVSLKNAIDVKDEEINRLNTTIQEFNQKIDVVEVTTSQTSEHCETIVHEKESLQNEAKELSENVAAKETELKRIKTELELVNEVLTRDKLSLETLTAEKTELINFITLKHNENIQYHNEIQRLNQIISHHTNEHKKLLEERDSILRRNEYCPECEKLRILLRERDERLELSQNAVGSDTTRQELANATDLIRNLTEKCEDLDKNLTIQLDAVKRLTTEKAQLSDREQSLSKELERLRRHLVETEETHTHELVSSEQRLNEYRSKLSSIEERAKQTGTVYTSNSIRTQQELETLRTQLRLLERQREEAQARLCEAEDNHLKGRVALANLQLVLEQFQSEKERDVEAAKEKLQNRCEDMRRANEALKFELRALNTKLEESMVGLKAAARLGDQLETKNALLNDYKEQVRALQETVRASEERYQAASRQQERVDKGLVKNLLLNYLQAAEKRTGDKMQVLRILSTVLDFNQWECERVGLVRAGTLAGAGADSLAREFVKFLEKESRPSAQLPNMMGLTQGSAVTSRSTTPLSRKNSGLGPQPTPLELHGHRRNTSSGSNNLLFQNIDTLESSSQVSLETSASETGSDRPRHVTLTTQNLLEHSGVNQMRNSEGAILKNVLKDI